MRVFLTHNREDCDAYYGRSLPELRAVAEVVPNQLDRDLTTAELIDAAVGCQVIIAHRSTPGEAELFAGLPDLCAFLRTAVDISTVDIDAASANGVLIAHADKSFVASTAELALGLLLDVVRNIATSTVDYRSGNVPPQRAGRQLRGMTAGVIGYGSIGTYLTDLLLGIGMKVLVADPAVDELAGDAQIVSIGDLLGRSDVVFPLVSSTPQTRGLIGSSELSKMAEGTYLINVSRGEILDEGAVVTALDNGRLAGVGIDVGSDPDQRPPSRLAARPDVVATPHLGGLTPENADAQAYSSVEQVIAITAGEVPPRAVNAEHATRLRSLGADG